MNKLKVLVVGSNGQLGREINALSSKNKNIDFSFFNSKNFDITDAKKAASIFKKTHFDYCINCAGYTDVERAEEEREKAYKINVEGVNNLAINCLKYNVKLMHISTDFVFDGFVDKPYKEDNKANPLNYYGLTKLKGEQVIQKILDQYFIIRSSWLYGKEGKNFVKTMLELGKTKDEIKVVNDQIGSPTNAKDLANFILYLINSKNKNYGIYHFSNKGETSWYKFVKEIYQLLDIKTKVIPIKSSKYLTKAKRPAYSVLSTEKTEKTTSFNIRTWEKALKDYLPIII